MSMLAAPDTITGPLTAQDLEAARQHSAGSIWHSPHRLDPHGIQYPDTVPVMPAEACTELGADAVERMWRHRRTRATVGRVMLLALAAYASHIVWPMLKLAA